LNVLSNLPLTALSIFAAVLLCIEAGYRFSVWRGVKERDEPFGVVEGTAYSIVALLLGFSFSLAVSHYDARRLLVVKEANAIGTTILRSETLPAPQARAMRDLLRDYVDARIAFVMADRKPAEQAKVSERSDKLQAQMWAIAVAEADRERTPVFALFEATLNDTIDVSAEESAALSGNIPDAVIVAMFVVILATSLLSGYGFGGSGRHAVASVLLALMIALVVAAILDLDSAQAGFIRVSLQPLQDVRALLTAP
jgi:hypothetical protein